VRAATVQVSHAITAWGFWHDYLITCRPYLCFVSGATGLVGLALVPALPAWTLAGAFAAFFFSYGFGQALTDVFQTDTDSLSAPYRPLVQGRIKGSQVLVVSLAGLAGCALFFLLCNPWTLVLSGLGVAGLATYTPLKRRWWGGPFWNSWIVACLPVIGVQCGVPGFSGAFRVRGLGWAVAGVFFSYATFVLLGYFKDVSADRVTGYDTLPVHFGWRVAVVVSGACALLAVASSLGLLLVLRANHPNADTGGILALVVWTSGAVLLVVSHVVMWFTHSEANAHGPIENCVRGYLLLHLGEASVARPSLSLLALVFYGVFEVALAMRPERRQV
jgi:4-hydroxybenzoate polyprenyltransferase